MNRFSGLFLSLALVSCISNSPKPPVTAAEICKDCAPPEGHLTVVIAENLTAQFFVRATLNGEARKFLFDTGALRSSLIVDNKTQGLAVTGHGRFGGFGMKPRDCDWVRAQSFKVGGWKYADAPITRCADGGMGNVLGLDFLHHQTLALNFEESTFSLKDHVPEKLKMTAMKRNSAGLLEVPLTVAGETVWALFDTGAGMTLVDQAFVDAHPKAFHVMTTDVDGKERTIAAPFKDSAGHASVGKLYFANGIEIEGVEKSEQLVTAIPFSKEFKAKVQAPLILGANSIMTANWFFNFAKNEFNASGFSPKAPKLKDLAVTGDQVLRADENTVVVRGNAKIANDDNWLTGPEITINVKKKTAHCEKDCIFAPAENRIYISPIDLDISDKDWLQMTSTPERIY